MLLLDIGIIEHMPKCCRTSLTVPKQWFTIVVVNTEFSTNKARDNTVSKDKHSQLQVDWINNHNVVFPDRGKSTSDAVHKCIEKGSTVMGECYSIPLSNRYEVLQFEQEDQVL